NALQKETGHLAGLLVGELPLAHAVAHVVAVAGALIAVVGELALATGQLELPEAALAGAGRGTPLDLGGRLNPEGLRAALARNLVLVLRGLAPARGQRLLLAEGDVGLGLPVGGDEVK